MRVRVNRSRSDDCSSCRHLRAAKALVAILQPSKLVLAALAKADAIGDRHGAVEPLRFSQRSIGQHVLEAANVDAAERARVGVG